MNTTQTETNICGKTYWSSSKAAEYIGLGKLAILKYAKNGKITHLPHGGRVWFLKEWLDAYINHTTVIGNRR